MFRRNLFAFALGLLTVGLYAPVVPAQPPANQVLQLGMAKTFFHDVPQPFIDIATAQFAPVMKMTTTLDGKLNTQFGALEIAQKLDANQLQIGVFNGLEFAWAQEKYPALQPIVVAVNPFRDVRAFVIVHKDNPAKSIADLRGKTLAMTLGTKEHCWVYADRKCADNNQANAAAFFAKIERSQSAQDALDDIARKKVDAAVLDTISLEFYKKIRLPVFTAHMRVLQQSESFPAAVLAYKKGSLNDATVKKFRDGLISAHQNPAGADMMKMLNIEAFEAVPNDFAKSVADILKAYPARQPWKVASR